jgi:hypothetical protein
MAKDPTLKAKKQYKKRKKDDNNNKNTTITTIKNGTKLDQTSEAYKSNHNS